MRKDVQHLRTADTRERHYATGDMAIAVERSKGYADTLAKEAPDVAREVETRRERDAAERAAAKQRRDQFTQAALRELEAKLRGERVYVGEIVDHGRAPYQFKRDNDHSYYVTLMTRDREQVIWGKGLAEAMLERNAGEQIVLQNIGKRDVTVQERVRDAQGQAIGLRPKESQLNAWKSELLSRFSEKARTDFSSRSAARQPSLGVYDAKAPRAPVQPAAPARATDQQRHAEQQRNSRER